MAALQACNPSVRSAAVRALEELRAIDSSTEVVRLLKDPDEEVRLHATFAVKGLRIHSAVGPLRSMLKDNKEENSLIRGAALHALARIAGSEAQAELRSHLTDASPYVAALAAAHLGEFRSREALADLCLAAATGSEDVRVAALDALFLIRDPACLPTILSLLKDPEPEVRKTAIQAMAHFGKKDDASRIEPFLADANPGVRASAALTLASLGHRESTPAIVKLLKDAEDDVRYSAINALGKLGDRTSIPSIMECLGDEGIVVPNTVAEVLAKLDAKDQIPKLVAALNDPEPRVRIGSMKALVELGAVDKIPDIARLLKGDDQLVRRYAAISLGKMAASDQVGALAKFAFDEGRQDVCLKALGRIGGPEADLTLLKAMKESKRFFRLEAASYLAWHGRRDGVEVILRESEKPRHFNALNALRRPDLWKKLNQTRLREPIRGRRSDVFRGIAAQLDCTLDLPKAFGRYEDSWLEEVTVADCSRESMFDLIESKMDTLDGEGPYGFVLEEGRLRLIPRNELPRFWKKELSKGEQNK
jgi:HEAT repeat protein